MQWKLREGHLQNGNAKDAALLISIMKQLEGHIKGVQSGYYNRKGIERRNSIDFTDIHSTFVFQIPDTVREN